MSLLGQNIIYIYFFFYFLCDFKGRHLNPSMAQQKLYMLEVVISFILQCGYPMCKRKMKSCINEWCLHCWSYDKDNVLDHGNLTKAAGRFEPQRDGKPFPLSESECSHYLEYSQSSWKECVYHFHCLIIAALPSEYFLTACVQNMLLRYHLSLWRQIFLRENFFHSLLIVYICIVEYLIHI